MARRLRSKLTYANVVSTLCLFVLLGGSAYAAKLITGRQIKDSTITTRDVKNRSLLSRDFRPGQLPAGAQGPQGERGLQGVPGQDGADGQDGQQGPPGISGYEVVTNTDVGDSSDTKLLSVECPTGKKVLGGGASTDVATFDGIVPDTEHFDLRLSRPFSDGSGWLARVSEEPAITAEWRIRVMAVCATVAP